MREKACVCRVSIPRCPEHSFALDQVVLEGHNETCPIGVWSCPVDKRTGKPMDDSISCENPLPDDAACDYMINVTHDLRIEEMSDDGEGN